jgi:hypothetical protein
MAKDKTQAFYLKYDNNDDPKKFYSTAPQAYNAESHLFSSFLGPHISHLVGQVFQPRLLFRQLRPRQVLIAENIFFS